MRVEIAAEGKVTAAASEADVTDAIKVVEVIEVNEVNDVNGPMSVTVAMSVVDAEFAIVDVAFETIVMFVQTEETGAAS